MITIGQLADYAGVTVKAVRHYHKRGLLAEPSRDPSGYRRYGAEHAIALVKIKTLAEAGVPLARVKELLAADPKRFAAAISEIDRKLQEQTERLRRARARIKKLRAGNRLFVSSEVADYLDQLRELGVSARTVEMERNVWVLLQSISPREATSWIADKCRAIGDPKFCAIYLEYDAVFDLSPDDPRLDRLAKRTERWLANRYGRSKRATPSVQDLRLARLVAASVGASSPAWGKLTTIIRKRALASRSLSARKVATKR